MKSKRIMPLLALVLLILTACGSQDDGALSGRTVYVPESVSFPAAQNFGGVCIAGDAAYLADWNGSSSSAPKLLRVPLTGGEPEELAEYRPAGSGFLTNVSLSAGTDGTLWMTEVVMEQSEDPDTHQFIQKYVHYLRQLNADGKELACHAFSGLGEKLGTEGQAVLLADGGGEIFALLPQGAALLDGEGCPRLVLEKKDATATGLILLSDGRAAVGFSVPGHTGEMSYILQAIDKEAGSWGEEFALTAGLPPVCYTGGGDALFFYGTSSSVWAWRTGGGEEAEESPESGTAEQLFTLADLGIEGYTSCLAALPDGRLAMLVGSANGGERFLYLLTPTDASQVKDRKILTYATLQLTSDQQAAVAAFNRTNTEYRVAVTDYSQYGDRQAALTRLATEIGAGRAPDLIDLYGIPTARWAASGLLEDLWPYIDKDPEISREDLMERVFQAAEIDGKLYEVSQYFWMSTLIGAKDVVGDRMTWTGADMWAALESMPDGCRPTSDSQSTMLRQQMGLDWSRFVDWEAGTCDFTGEEFKSLLRFCADFPKDTAALGEKGLYDGEQMLMSWMVTGFDFPQMARFLLGGDASYVGYPNEWGQVGSSFAFVSPAAMSSACQDKEGAWAFLRAMLLPRGEAALQASGSLYFPVNREDFQQAAELAMTPRYQTAPDGTYVLDDSGEKIESPARWESFPDIPENCLHYAVSQEEYGQLMDLYNAIDTYTRQDSGLESIVLEAAGAYFAGDKSLDETAELIQNRASLYVNEQT